MAGYMSSSPTTTIDAYRISTSTGSVIKEKVSLAVENLLTIEVKDVDVFKTACSPVDTEALAIGLLFSEGLIENIQDIKQIEHNEPELESFYIHLTDFALSKADSNRFHERKSCKMSCGSTTRLESFDELSQVADSFRVHPAWLEKASTIMHDLQSLFAKTGGTHAAAIVSSQGETISFGEDIGRHNALDKAIGKCLLNNVSTQGQGIMLSGRVSLEMLMKAAKAGIELVAAVSAPSSLAIKAAQHCNVTLCGFVREDRATIFTHPHRILINP